MEAGCRQVRSLLTQGFTMTTESFQSQEATLLSLLMLERNIDEMLKVNFMNLAAIAVSLSDFDQWIRTAGMVAAFIYTVVKIVQTIQEMRKK